MGSYYEIQKKHHYFHLIVFRLELGTDASDRKMMYDVRNHEPPQWYDIVSSHGFALGFPEKPHTNGDVFLTYKPMIIP